MIKTLFSSQSEMKLKEHTKALFVDKQKSKKYFSSFASLFKTCNLFTYVLFFINVLFYSAMFIGTLFLLTDYSSGLEIIFSGFTISLLLLVAGIIVYKYFSTLTGAVLMLVSTLTKYFSVYTSQNKSPFDLSATNLSSTQLGAPKAQLFMHFIPQLLLFLVCLYIIITLIREKVIFNKMYNQICNKIYSLKKEEDSLFTDQEQWNKYVDEYLSGEYKNFKHPKRSIRKRLEKEEDK